MTMMRRSAAAAGLALAFIAAILLGLATANILPIARPSATPLNTPAPATSPTVVALPTSSGDPGIAGSMSGTWSAMTAMPPIESYLITDTVFLPPRTVLVFFPLPDSDEIQELPILSLDIETGEWSELWPETQPEFGSGSDDVLVLANDGLIYRLARFVHRYDPAANAWEHDAVADLGEQNVRDAIAVSPSAILMVTQPLSPFTCIQILELATGTVATLSCADHSYSGVWRLADKQFLLYGEDGMATFDLELNAWTSYGPTPGSLPDYVGADRGTDGLLYVLDTDHSGISLVFDPLTASWFDIPDPMVDRGGPEVVAVPDGRIFLIGGHARLNDILQLELRVEVFLMD